MKAATFLTLFFYLSSQLSNVENPSDEQEFALQYFLARASHPGFHPLGVLNKRLLSMPLEQMSGDLTYAFSDFLGLGSGRFAFEVHRGQETYDYHPMTIRDAAIKDAANRENNPLLQTNSEIFSGYMNPYCQKYIASETLKVEFSEKWVQQQFDGQGKFKEHVYLWHDGQFQLYYQLAASEEGPLKLNEIGDRRWFEALRFFRTF